MKIKNILFLTFLIFVFACNQSNYENNIPYNKVNFLVYPLTDFGKALTAPGGIGVTSSCNHNGGLSCGYSNHGIIICRMMMSDTYAAYAATCPEDLSKLQIPDNTVLKAKCPKCARVFELDNNGFCGNVRLTQYKISISATNQFFRVYN